MPELNTIGKLALDSVSWTAFFCSVRCPGKIILDSYDLAQKWRAEERPVIGGFHSPVEKEVLKIMLRSTAPLCIALARGLPKRIPAEYKPHLEKGRLLLASFHDAKVKRATKESAEERNFAVASLAEKIFVAYAAPGGKTETFCRAIARLNKPCFTFKHEANQNLISMGFKAIE
ncbi:MAG: DNA-binding protein [Kiritimatiellae bacterium]|nr:DNA-binding protein [Kiritimatiellia bacterium]